MIALAVVVVIAAAVVLTAIPHRSLSNLLTRWKGERASESISAGRAASLDQAAKPTGVPAAAPSPASGTAQPPVYVTTAQQLYLDYSANALATQNRIGNGMVRVTGNVTEIEEDLAGHPVIKLSAGVAESADMLLNDDQRAAAAQLIKGESVGVQCEKIQRDPVQHSGAPQGSGCVLVLIDAGATPVYLAVSSANDKAALYIVGPMPESACLSRGELISHELGGNFGRDEVISRRCTPTARESIPGTGCQLSTSMAAVPDMPDAHLWKYDCAAPPPAATGKVAERKVAGRKPGTKKSTRKSAAPTEEGAAAAMPMPVSEPSPPVPEPLPPVPEPLPPVPDLPGDGPDALPAAAPVITAFQSSATPAAAAAGAAAPPATSFDAVSVSPNVNTTALPSSDVTAPPTAPAPSPATPAAAAPSPAPAAAPLPDDLSAVKSSDPAAAEHIASYCNGATASAKDQSSVAAGCRHEEVAAWQRLVVNNEFPSLDDATRRKCKEPPFPDSYVAEESCARYQLHAK
ncbi:MAG TPA: hypothetical protein VHY75_08980 [Steroidobacteraceae bacterium]|nr:hypothetical protein [Steroidobacteraceae bacterium]